MPGREVDIALEVLLGALDLDMVAPKRASCIAQSPVQYGSSRHSMQPIVGAILDRQRRKMQS
jgi:hypothetical protein